MIAGTDIDVDGLRSALLEVIAEERRVNAGESIRALHADDSSPHPASVPDLVVFPHTVAEVSAVLALANARGVAVTPFGMGTSTDGHVIPLRRGISLDLTEMDGVVRFRPEDQMITVGPGISRSAVNRRAGEHGLLFPVDPGADASIGGMVATNASGTTTVRYGNMRKQVLALQVVLADGTVVRTGSRALKSSAGYDLGQLFVGSEGTLGVIVEVTLRLYGIPEHTVAARAAFPDLDAACGAARALIGAGVLLSRMELLDAYCVQALNRFKDMTLPELPCLLLEFAGSREAVQADSRFAAEVAAEYGCAELELEADHTARVRLWQARHDLPPALAHLRPGSKLMTTDVCVPISELPAAVAAGRAAVERLKIVAGIVGHVGEGNYHITYAFDPDDPDEQDRAEILEAEVIEHALACGGTCSGEHGIGIGKIRHLATEHADLLPLMRGIKQQLDPNGILNPGKVFTA
ncbi:MAG: FAD-binding protein [Solirubrobacteraceae bacterium]|nr:FAD-binding protein [Solirubrobacteraceae bacterium]